MTSDFLDPAGLVVPESALELRRGRELVQTLLTPDLAYASLVECRASRSSETVVLDVEVERPQLTANDIRRVERIAAVFARDDAAFPEVLALRDDFPSVPHVNLREQELPRSLCLYDRPWSEVRVTWSAPTFIERIRWWLAQTARHTLHQHDQALEPLIQGCGWWLVVPYGLSDTTTPQQLDVLLPGGESGRVLVAQIRPEGESWTQCTKRALLVVRTPSQQHGVIRCMPKTLADLSALLSLSGCELLTTLREHLRGWSEDGLLRLPLILLLILPKTRREQGSVESVELKAFMTKSSAMELGEAVGVWDIRDDKRAHLVQLNESRDGSDVDLLVLNVCETLTRSAAARLNAATSSTEDHMVAIGTGALGSQVAMNLARAGWGRWTLVDEDDLLPHNLARHALDGFSVGSPKADAVALRINSLTNDERVADAITTNVLDPGDQSEQLAATLGSAALVLDMSTSVAVARQLAFTDADIRRFSLFLSPSGNDLVLLAEDRQRTNRLDHLEMLYYGALAFDERLGGHLSDGMGGHRFGLSCRDTSSRIPQELVALHGGIGAASVRRAYPTDAALIRVWRCSRDTMAVSVVDVSVETMMLQQHGEWTLLIAPQALRRVTTLCRSQLPNETGGILIGSFDTDRRVAYLVDALPSPPDSEEWPQLYVRGCRGLREQLESVQERTAGNLSYFGEWHSHPNGVDTLPSHDDREVFGWIAEQMLPEGNPPVMLIAGEGERSRVFLGQMTNEASQPLCPH